MIKLALLSFFCVAAMCVVCVLYIDLPMLQMIAQDREPILPIFTEISRLGHGTLWFALSAFILLSGVALRYWKAFLPWNNMLLIHLGGFALASLAITGIVTRLAKWGVGRWRPRYWFEQQIYDFTPFALESYKTASLPSGHSQTIATVVVVVGLFKPKWLPYLLPVALLVGAARMVLLQHYLADVIAGLWLGTVGPMLIWVYWNRHCRRSGKEQWHLRAL